MPGMDTVSSFWAGEPAQAASSAASSASASASALSCAILSAAALASAAFCRFSASSQASPSRTTAT
ncbi:MAG: hypothetical protein R2856_04305 [Caldilineaceae bacterium]